MGCKKNCVRPLLQIQVQTLAKFDAGEWKANEAFVKVDAVEWNANEAFIQSHV